MIDHRPFASLGHAPHGWLDAHHHFSFADYHDPQRMHWGALRVWNDDRIAPGTGFPPHPHRDMEIITYVRSGAISHRDTLGNEGRTLAGDVQIMSAGSGITHSEYNHEESATEIFQIWIMPDTPGGAPHWGTRRFPIAGRDHGFVTLASGMVGDSMALPIRANARVAAAVLSAGQTIDYRTDRTRHLYLVPARGTIEIDGVVIAARDGVAIRDVEILRITARDDSEVLLVDSL